MLLTHLDLFSGIGGFAYGLQLTGGFKTVAFCEIDSFCQKVLRKNFPGTPIYDNILTFDGSDYAAVDIITGGFPCQPYSHAGKQQGADDARALWKPLCRVIERLKPRWFLGENVTGIINMELDTVLLDLESIGYTTQALIIPACAVDAPHRRDRVWIIANTRHAEPQRRSEPATDNNRRSETRQPARGESTPPRCAVSDSEHLRQYARQCRNCGAEESSRRSYWLKSNRCCEQYGTIPNTNESRTEVRLSEKRRNEKRDSEKLINNSNRRTRWQRKSEWSVEPDVGRVANGIPDRVDRLKALGNAVVPQVVEQIGYAILAAEGLIEL